MVEKVLQINMDKQKTIFWSLLGVLFVSVIFYMYFINTTIHNVVMRQNLEAESSQLTMLIGTQEFQYITARNAITLAVANSLGFREVSAKTFISKSHGNQVSFLSR